MKYVFIINPISGRGRALKAADTIKKVCEDKKLKYEIWFLIV